MSEPMSDERLARLAADNEPVGDHLSGLTADEVAELVAEVQRQRFEIARANQEIETLSSEVEAEHGEAEEARAELAEVREAHRLSEAQLIEVTLERAEWRKQAQTHETVAKILRADLAAANQRTEEQTTAHDHWLSYSGDLENRLAEARNALTVAAELIDRLTDDSPCDYDHHDNCRTHSLHARPCPHPLGRQFVEAWRAVEAEQKEAADDDQ